MIHYFLELEESIGKVWDRFLHKKVTKLHTNHSVALSDISTALTLFYHLLGGKIGKSIQATDKRTIDTKRTILEKISLDYAFNILNLRKIYFHVISFNKASRQNLEKYFKCKNEGCLKKHVFWNNEYHDVLILSLFKDDFNQQ